MPKSMTTNKCTSVAGNFDGLADTPVLHWAHHPMEGVQGFTRSHQTPPSGNYSLRFAPAAAMVSIKKTTTKNAPYLLAILMAVAVCRYDTAHIAQWRRSRAMLDTTGRRHRASIVADSSQLDIPTPFFMFFIVKFVEKGLGSTQRPQLTIGVWHIKMMRRT